ncbi:MAG: cytochrome c family protein [Desulfomonile sp.]|nr:cytochrome c family protein [Desulfomonile sp.]
MKKGRVFLAFVVCIAVAAALTLAYAASKMPDKPIVIDSTTAIPDKKRGPVNFDHTKHKDFKCTQCHHEYKDGNNVWQEGQEVKKCSECHKKEDQGKQVKLEKAMHDQCVKCHKDMKKEKKQTGPTACTKCHPKGGDDK